MFNIETKQVFETLNTNRHGLAKAEAQARLTKTGLNKLQEAKKTPLLIRFLEKFKDLLILVLLGAAALSVAIAILEKSYSEILDAGIILFVVLVNAVIGLVQENKADKAMESLKRLTKPYAKVVREDKVVKVKTEELVPGDIVVLEAGDIVPADLRLFEVASLKVEESSITGESVPSEKNTAIIDESNVPLGDQHNMAFMGTVVTYGRAKGVVVATGMQTQIGKIAGVIAETENEITPLTKRINKTAKVITIAVLTISVGILISNIVRGDSFTHAFMIAIAIAVSVIPEGLPAALTITLSIGAERMSKQKAIIKKLPAVETLGSCEVICSDKTGTLTLNKMTVQQLYVTALPHYLKEIEQSSKLPEQKFEQLQHNKSFSQLLNCMLLCNDTQLKYENEVLTTIGDPTETALVHYGFANHVNKDNLDGSMPRIGEIPFDSERKMMTTVVKNSSNELVSYTKGAIDSILPHCKLILENGTIRELTPADNEEILKVNKIYAGHALRVLAFAMKVNVVEPYNENNLVFVGLCGLIDPPREEVFEAIQTCKTAGILPIMITGDHKDTAFAIAKELGIATSLSQVITGVELDNISDHDLVETVNKFKVFARVNPEHKVKIVRAFKAQGKVVAMTGDGVNDAPSLKSADIGIGMGITGTDVTKGVADMILTDDNFATIVNAVKEGRKVYSNILKIIQFLLTTGIAEVILMVTVIAILGRSFFTPALILYINFVSDTLVALALGDEKPEPNIMKKKPNNDNGNLLFSKVGFNILYMSVIQSIIILTLYFLCLNVWGFYNEITVTMCFISLVCMELFHSYNLRSETESLFTLGVFKNKYLNYGFFVSFVLTAIIVLLPIPALHQVMGIVDLNVSEWAISILFAFSIVPLVEIVKIFIRAFGKKEHTNRKKHS